jgi:hypothetical protein
MYKDAVFSECRKHRYKLWRQWSGGTQSNYAMFIGLNPSTADEMQDDPTIRRCIGYARAWGYDGLCMTNLFAFRATDPKVMMAESDPIGPDNDFHLRGAAAFARVVVCCWGANGSFKGRDKTVRDMFSKLNFLRLTKNGSPGHPLYLPKDLIPTLWVHAPITSAELGSKTEEIL